MPGVFSAFMASEGVGEGSRHRHSEYVTPLEKAGRDIGWRMLRALNKVEGVEDIEIVVSSRQNSPLQHHDTYAVKRPWGGRRSRLKCHAPTASAQVCW